MTTVAPFSLACLNRGSDVKVQACPLIWTESILHLLPLIFSHLFSAYPIPSHPLFLTTPSPHSLPSQSPLFSSFSLSPFSVLPTSSLIPSSLSPSLPFTPFLPSLLLSPHSLPYSLPSHFCLLPLHPTTSTSIHSSLFSNSRL